MPVTVLSMKQLECYSLKKDFRGPWKIVIHAGMYCPRNSNVTQA